MFLCARVELCLVSAQKASKEPILEEAELEFKPLEECEEGQEEEESPETKEAEAEAQREAVHKGLAAPVHLTSVTWPPCLKSSSLSQRCQECQTQPRPSWPPRSRSPRVQLSPCPRARV